MSSKYLSLVVLPLLLAGCSESVPLAAEGAFMVALVPGSHSSECLLDLSQPTMVGNVTDTTHDALVKDTVNGAVVYCLSTESTGGPVEGGIHLSADSLEFKIPNLSPSATDLGHAVDGQLTYSGTQATSGVTFTSPAAEPCKFYFANDLQRSQLAPGTLWVTFECPTVQNVSKQRACAVSLGYAAFQNCE